MKTFLHSFRYSVLGLLAAVVLGAFYGGGAAVALVLILTVVEFTFSFDNATVNARILERMSAFWQRMFLSVGIIVAVIGMRFVFPLVVVSFTAQIWPWEAVKLAFAKGSIHTPGTYAYELHAAHPSIAAFGGMFLLILALDFLFEEREVYWLKPIETRLARIGKLDQLSVVIAGICLVVASTVFAQTGGDKEKVLFAGALGIVAYLAVNGFGNIVGPDEDDDDEASEPSTLRQLAPVVGTAAVGMFFYLEMIDASFSFDGVIGAFAITPDPIIIMLGLGVGALFVRSLTVYLVKQGTLNEYRYLEHGAQWAIATLALLLLVTIRYDIPDLVTGGIGLALIAAAFVTSLIENRRDVSDDSGDADALADGDDAIDADRSDVVYSND
jgi:hypothetical protein